MGGKGKAGFEGDPYQELFRQVTGLGGPGGCVQGLCGQGVKQG